MAHEKLTDRNQLTTPADGDKMHIVDVSDNATDAAGNSKYVTVSDLMTKAPVQSVNGATGTVSLAVNDLSNVNASSPSDNDVLSWDSATSRYLADGRLSTLYANLKQGTSTTINDGANSNSKMQLTGTTAELKTGVTGLTITETSPGDVEFDVATDGTGSTTFTALHLDGTTTANQADLLVKLGCNFKLEDGSFTQWLRPSSGNTGNTQISLPDTSGQLALDADVPTTTDDLPEGSTNLYYPAADATKLAGIATGATANQTDAYLLSRANHTGTQVAATISDFDTEVSNNTSVVANTAKRSYPLADETKLAGIAAGAEVNVNADWNATSGDALILNKPTIPTNTNLGNANLTANTNRTYDIDGNALTIQLTSGDFLVQDGATTRIEVNPLEVQINGLQYPATDGTSGQVMTTDGLGNLSFTTVSGGGGGTPLASADQTLTGNRLIDTNGYNLEIELDPTGTADTFTIHDGTHDLFEVNTNTSGTLFSVNDVSGLPTFQSNDDGSAVMPKILTAAPTGTATEGTMQLAIVSGTSYLYVYINGAWRKTTLA